MKQILILILFFCTLSVSAQDAVVKRNKKEQTSSVESKRKAEQEVAKKRAEAERQEQARQEQEETARKAKEQEARRQQEKQRQNQLRIDQNKRNALRWDEEQNALCFNGRIYKMINVTGGTFKMGATKEQGKENKREKRVHTVTLSSYTIGQTEVTQSLWQVVMGNNPSSCKGDNLPVENVSWNDCQVFIKKLNTITGMKFRLPTEAEWEFASRGGINSRGYKYSGSNDLSEVACPGETTYAVGTMSPNEIGIYDMSGNVSEWCNDYWGDYSSKNQYNPTGPSTRTSDYHVIRGGTSSDRNSSWPDFRGSRVGLRLALTKPVTITIPPQPRVDQY